MSEKNNFSLKYKFSSPEEPGFHTVISPENSNCKLTYVFRLNLRTGESYELHHDKLELNAVLITGEINITNKGLTTKSLVSRDSFYIPSGERVLISAISEVFIYIGGGPFEGIGSFFIRKYNLNQLENEIHQVHGEVPFQREVFMTVNQEVPASRIIAGVTFGEPGGWTSWPPHQHTKDLEEVYCYFNIPKPKFALHLSWRTPGAVEEIFPVSTGDCVIVPEGYHPTVAIPGVRSCYFWVMVSHSHKQRRYDLAVNDPNFEHTSNELKNQFS